MNRPRWKNPSTHLLYTQLDRTSTAQNFQVTGAAIGDRNQVRKNLGAADRLLKAPKCDLAAFKSRREKGQKKRLVQPWRALNKRLVHQARRRSVRRRHRSTSAPFYFSSVLFQLAYHRLDVAFAIRIIVVTVIQTGHCHNSYGGDSSPTRSGGRTCRANKTSAESRD